MNIDWNLIQELIKSGLSLAEAIVKIVASFS